MNSLQEVEYKDIRDELDDYIYNRYDLWRNKEISDIKFWKYNGEDKIIYFESCVRNKAVELGLWLVNLRRKDMDSIIKSLFFVYPEIPKIYVRNSYVDSQFAFRCSKGNFFRIELPSCVDDLDARLSAKGRYNIRREKKILIKNFGSYNVKHYNVNDIEAVEYWNKYFQFKKRTHGTEYGLKINEYIDKYNVTDMYLLLLGDNNRLASMVLSCEQCSNVFVENLTYDIELAKYSVGQILYDEYLKLLIVSGRKGVYLLGGNYEYKKRYGSIEESIYSFDAFRNSWEYRKYKIKMKFKHIKEKYLSGK